MQEGGGVGVRVGVRVFVERGVDVGVREGVGVGVRVGVSWCGVGLGKHVSGLEPSGPLA